jgi:hypothetical protein
MADHTHHPVNVDLGTRLMAMSAGRRMQWAAVGVALLWLAVWWALSFDARAMGLAAAARVTEVVS